MTLSQQQIEQRRHGIGSSDVPAIACLSLFRGPIDVWVRKLGIIEDEGQADAAEVGSECEGAVARIGARRHGVQLVGWKSTTLAHPEHPWMLATPDRGIWNGRPYRNWKEGVRSTEEFRTRVTSLVEIKVVGRWMWSRWGESGDPRGVPDDVAAQCQWQMMVLGVPRCEVWALLGTELRTYPLEHSDSFADALFRASAYFWFHNVLEQQEPELDGSESSARYVVKRFPTHDDRLLRADAAAVEAVRELAAVRAELQELEARRDALEVRLQRTIGDAAGLEGNGFRVTWKKPESGSPRFKDLALHLGATPEQIVQFTSEPSRRFVVSGELFPKKNRKERAA